MFNLQVSYFVIVSLKKYDLQNSRCITHCPLLTGPCVQEVHCSSCQSWSCSIQTVEWPFSLDNPKKRKTELRKCDNSMNHKSNLFVFWLFSCKKVYLHGTINFTAVKHEVEEVQVSHCRLPGHIFCFTVQVLGGIEGQYCRDDFCSLGSQDFKNEILTWSSCINSLEYSQFFPSLHCQSSCVPF